jgi:hypothetical protein
MAMFASFGITLEADRITRYVQGLAPFQYTMQH